MKHKLHFNLILIAIILLFITIIPIYSNAVAIAEDILKQDLSNATMQELVDWRSTLLANTSNEKDKAYAKISNEIRNRLSSSSISPSDALIGIQAVGTDNLSLSTLQNISNKLGGAYNGHNNALDWKSKVDAKINNAESGQIDVVDNPEYFTPTGGNSAKLTSIGKTILAVINVVGVVVAVVALGILGLRYMFGSVEERANYKETLVPYIIGLVMLGGITTIVNIIYNIAIRIGN